MMPANAAIMNIHPILFRKTRSVPPDDLSACESCERCSSRGFSLIVVVMALGIFAFVIIPVIGLVSGGMKNLRQSMDDTVRSDIAREIVGEALRSPWTNLVNFTNATFYYTDEGMLTNSTGALFKVSNSLSAAPGLLGVNTNCQLFTTTVQHISDTNNMTVYTQLIINTGQ